MTFADLNINNLLYRDVSTPDTNTVINSDGSISMSNSGSVSDYNNEGSTETISETIVSGEIAGNLIMVDGFIRSKNYIAGSTGWTINADGTSQLNNLTLTGGTINYQKTSFSDSTNAGYYISADGIYFGAAADATYLKYVISTGAFDVKGALSTAAGSVINGTYVDSLNVNKLAAGTITSKTITLAVSDGAGDSYIAAGKTDFTNTDAGFIIGVDDSDSNKAKFYIGNSSSYLNWDGTTFTVTGASIINAPATNLMNAGEDFIVTTPIPVVINTVGNLSTEEKIASDTSVTLGTRIHNDGDKKFSMSFVTPYDINILTSVDLYSYHGVDATGANLEFYIYLADANHKPTGAALASLSKAYTDFGSGGAAWVNINFSDIAVSPLTEYCIVGTNFANSSVNAALIVNKSTTATAGSAFESTSSDMSVWEQAIDDLAFKVNGYWASSVGDILKADDTKTQRLAYTGFVTTTGLLDTNVRVQFTGIVGGFSGLTPGSTYYLNISQASHIHTSAGVNSVKVGRAVSTTDLLIYQLNI